MNTRLKKFDDCLVGYYGMSNTGDDALLAATMWGAKNYLSAKNVTITTPSRLTVAGETKREEPRQATLTMRQRFRGQNRISHYCQAVQSKRIIFGGGSVLHTAQDINIKRHMMRLSGAGHHLAVGVGLGPFVDVAAESACKKFLDECGFVGVRDIPSYDIARAIAPNANVSLTFDLAPLLLCNQNVEIKPLSRTGFAVCLCPTKLLEGTAKKTAIRDLTQCLISVYEQTGEAIVLLNLNGHEQLGDKGIHKELIDALRGRIPLRLVAYDPNPFRVLQCLASFKAVISMRLHGAILAHLVGTPSISLHYHEKCSAWAEQVGMPKNHQFNIFDLDVTALVRVLVDGLNDVFDKNHLSIAATIDAAKSNWRLAI